VNTESIGVASMMLGGGRKKASDTVDPRVGIAVHKRIGDRVDVGDVLVTLHHADVGVDEAMARALSAFSISDDKRDAPALFGERIAG
jgi:pyrimidine-nucleoside phosphorylase